MSMDAARSSLICLLRVPLTITSFRLAAATSCVCAALVPAQASTNSQGSWRIRKQEETDGEATVKPCEHG